MVLIDNIIYMVWGGGVVVIAYGLYHLLKSTVQLWVSEELLNIMKELDIKGFVKNGKTKN